LAVIAVIDIALLLPIKQATCGKERMSRRDQYGGGGGSDPYGSSRAPAAVDSRGRSDTQRDSRQPPPHAAIAYHDPGYDNFYDNDRRVQEATRRSSKNEPRSRDREDRSDRYRGDRRDEPNVAGTQDKDDETYGGDAQYVTENKLLKVELEQIMGQMEALRSEYDETRSQLSDAKQEAEKRETENEELKEQCRQLEAENAELRKRSTAGKEEKGRGKESSEVEKLKAELEKKAKLIDKLMSEKDEGGDDDELKAKVKELKKENEKLKKATERSGSTDQKGQLEKLASTIKAKDQLINEINQEKDELMALLEDEGNGDKFKKMKKEAKELKKSIAELKELNENLETELASLSAENEMLKSGKETGDGKHKKGCPHMECRKACQSSDECKKCCNSSSSKECPKDLRLLKDLVREQESHIVDLQREVDTLRHAINDYQKELERYDGATDTLVDSSSSRLYQSAVQDRKAAILDREDTDTKRELDQTRRKLRSSSRRVAQLEKWLDEIYNDKNFEIVVKGASIKGRKTMLSLPELPTADASPRKGPPSRRQFLLSKGADFSTKNSGRSSYFN
jgi:chromosome segregation ATPase